MRILSCASTAPSPSGASWPTPALPVVLRGGEVLGSLCATDTRSREWSDEDLAVLSDLGMAVATEIELRTELAERRRLEAELRVSQDRLANILDSGPAMVFAKDLEGRYILANRNLTRLYGLDREKILGHTDYDLFDRDTADALRANDRLASRLPPGEAWEGDEVGLRDGEERIFRTTKFAARDASGEVFGVFGVSVDQTERIRTERALREARERLQAAFDHAPIGKAIVTVDGRIPRSTRRCASCSAATPTSSWP